jgi:hypothetical protein
VYPVVANYADPQSVNAYSYARNNTVNLTDTTGAWIDILNSSPSGSIGIWIPSLANSISAATSAVNTSGMSSVSGVSGISGLGAVADAAAAAGAPAQPSQSGTGSRQDPTTRKSVIDSANKIYKSQKASREPYGKQNERGTSGGREVRVGNHNWVYSGYQRGDTHYSQSR